MSGTDMDRSGGLRTWMYCHDGISSLMCLSTNSLATFVGVVIAVSDVDVPHATKIYTALVVAFAALNRWVTKEFERKEYV